MDLNSSAGSSVNVNLLYQSIMDCNNSSILNSCNKKRNNNNNNLEVRPQGLQPHPGNRHVLHDYLTTVQTLANNALASSANLIPSNSANSSRSDEDLFEEEKEDCIAREIAEKTAIVKQEIKKIEKMISQTKLKGEEDRKTALKKIKADKKTCEMNRQEIKKLKSQVERLTEVKIDCMNTTIGYEDLLNSLGVDIDKGICPEGKPLLIKEDDEKRGHCNIWKCPVVLARRMNPPAQRKSRSKKDPPPEQQPLDETSR